MQQTPKEHYAYPGINDVHYGSIYGLEDEENNNGAVGTILCLSFFLECGISLN